MRRTDRWMDGRTDKPAYIRMFEAFSALPNHHAFIIYAAELADITISQSIMEIVGGIKPHQANNDFIVLQNGKNRYSNKNASSTYFWMNNNIS